MKKLVIVFISLYAVFLGQVYAYAEESYDVRNTRWGMGRDEVLKHEKNMIYPIDNNFMLSQERNFHGLEFMLAYMFSDNKLVSIIHLYSGGLPTQEVYKKSFQSLVDDLTEKYGQPIRLEMPSESDFKKPDFVPQGNGQWQHEKTKAILMLSSTGGKAVFRLIFHDPKFTKEDAMRMEQEIINQAQ